MFLLINTDQKSSKTRIIAEAGFTIRLGGGGQSALPATENVALSLQRLIERPKRVGGRECAGVQGLSGSPSRRKPEREAVGWDAAFS